MVRPCIQVFLALILFLAIGDCKKGEPLTVTECKAKVGSDQNQSYLSYKIVSKGSSCMHYMWGMWEYPALFLAHTYGSKNCTCSSSSITFNTTTGFPEIKSLAVNNSDFSLAIVFMRLLEFDGTGDYLAASGLNMSAVCIESADDATSFNSTLWQFNATASGFIGTLRNTSAQFEIKTTFPEYTGSARLKYFPKTLYTENSTVFDIVSKKFPLNSNISNGRLALELVLVHGPDVKNGSISQSKSSDDEYTPSVFTTQTYKASTGYAQWKPISYQSSGRKSTESQQVAVKLADIEECEVSGVPPGLASILKRGARKVGNLTRWFVVFGTPGDNTYINPTYNTWTVVAGYGTVPKDRYSTVIIVTIIVGVGIPVVLVMLGGVYIFIRKKPWQNVSRFINSQRGRGYSRLS